MLFSRKYSYTISQSNFSFLTDKLDVTHKSAQAFSNHGGKVYRCIYTYTLPDPFPGSPFYWVAHHFVDSIILKLSTLLHLLPSLQKVAIQHTRYWINFAYGEVPWDLYITKKKGGQEKINHVELNRGGGARWKVVPRDHDEEDLGRRYAHWRVMES